MSSIGIVLGKIQMDSSGDLSCPQAISLISGVAFAAILLGLGTLILLRKDLKLFSALGSKGAYICFGLGGGTLFLDIALIVSIVTKKSVVQEIPQETRLPPPVEEISELPPKFIPSQIDPEEAVWRAKVEKFLPEKSFWRESLSGMRFYS